MSVPAIHRRTGGWCANGRVFDVGKYQLPRSEAAQALRDLCVANWCVKDVTLKRICGRDARSQLKAAETRYAAPWQPACLGCDPYKKVIKRIFLPLHHHINCRLARRCAARFREKAVLHAAVPFSTPFR